MRCIVITTLIAITLAACGDDGNLYRISHTRSVPAVDDRQPDDNDAGRLTWPVIDRPEPESEPTVDAGVPTRDAGADTDAGDEEAADAGISDDAGSVEPEEPCGPFPVLTVNDVSGGAPVETSSDSNLLEEQVTLDAAQISADETPVIRVAYTAECAPAAIRKFSGAIDIHSDDVSDEDLHANGAEIRLWNAGTGEFLGYGTTAPHISSDANYLYFYMMATAYEESLLEEVGVEPSETVEIRAELVADELPSDFTFILYRAWWYDEGTEQHVVHDVDEELHQVDYAVSP